MEIYCISLATPVRNHHHAAIFTICCSVWAVAQPVVPGFDRFQLRTTIEDQIASGEVLITELNCIGCHPADKSQKHRFGTRPAPVLFTAHNPASASWLRHWLNDPQDLKPGTLMPDLLHGFAGKDKARVVDALRQYLVSLTPPLGNTEVTIGRASEGRKLYETIGCAQCHAPDARDNGRDAPLGELRQKYTREQLVQFLLNPLHSRPAGRMPRVPMTRQETAHIAAFLRGRTPPRKDVALANGPAALKLHEEGKALFLKMRCANCHSTRGSNIPPNLSRPLTRLDLARGCLSARPPKGVPHFHLNTEQIKAITAALRAKPREFTIREQTRRRLRLLNCTACHTRGDLGEPDPARDKFFATTGNDLGDEGRLPPPLTGVGAKLTDAALYKVIRGEDAVRPYMTTRMPDFGEAHARFLAPHLAAADGRANVKPTPRDGKENKVGRNHYGRELVGVKGLNCITCHQLGGRESLGIQAMDLAHSSNRLRPEWFRDYLINPARFRPGTRMPSFWPEGKAVSKIFGRNTSRQIDSIWVYLNEFEQTRLPEGFEKKGGFELKPDKRPIVFRTFMESAGTHSIAIGFPQGIHAAFNSEQVGWSLLWRGKFLDAESTWDDRFTPLAPPLGKSVVTLRSGPGVALLKNLEQPWPKDGLQMRGYRLAKNGTPSILYSRDTTKITDTLTPRGKGLRRQMEFTGAKGNLWVRLATAKVFLSDKPGVWSTNTQLSIIAPNSQVRRIGEISELIAPVKFDGSSKATIEIEWHWK